MNEPENEQNEKPSERVQNPIRASGGFSAFKMLLKEAERVHASAVSRVNRLGGLFFAMTVRSSTVAMATTPEDLRKNNLVKLSSHDLILSRVQLGLVSTGWSSIACRGFQS
jgi:hypothetical protein